MDDLFDLLYDLFGWVLPLIGKFWFLILGYLGYKLFGQAAKKAAQDQKRRTLTPVESGGFPTTPRKVERKTVLATSRYEPVKEAPVYEEWEPPYEPEADSERRNLEGMERSEAKAMPKRRCRNQNLR